METETTLEGLRVAYDGLTDILAGIDSEIDRLCVWRGVVSKRRSAINVTSMAVLAELKGGE